MLFSHLDTVSSIPIFNLSLICFIMEQLVVITNSYAQQQLLDLGMKWQKSWLTATSQELYFWLLTHIHLDRTGFASAWY
jgi:drug/metabolite transporter superfamily protein YnfA